VAQNHSSNGISDTYTSVHSMDWA